MPQTNTKQNLGTKNPITWCPGCPNFLILESAKKAISELIDESKGKIKQEDFAMSTGIGCHAKIFDYLNISGIYGLHGRTISVAEGIKIGNEKLKVLAFAGDGDTYAEGMEHFIHAFRHNEDITLIVHENQSFSLTTGQPTPTTQQGYKSKATPQGEREKPLNPIKLALAAGGTFIARTNARNIAQTTDILKKAIKHKGFSFVEVMQDCLIFNKEMDNKDSLMYLVENKDKAKAEKLADEWNYNSKSGKIPVGIIYEESQ